MLTSALRRAIWLCSVLFLASTLRAQTSFSSVVVFGDSLSDTGNIAHLVQNANPLGIRYPSDSQLLGLDYTDGRFTDGADTQPAASAYLGVWVEQLAASFAAKPPVKDSLDGGTNYAYGDATTANGTSTDSRTVNGLTISINLHNMGQQVQDYLANIASRSASAPNAGTLYVLWGGANDVYQAASNGGNPSTAAISAVANEVALIQQLASAGATNFMVPNLPPLGGVPQAATTPAATALNTAAAVFAQAMPMALANLKMSLAANGVTITIYQPDIFGLYTTVASNPMAIGLGNVTMAAQNISASPDTYLSWDGLHPTTTGHHIAAAAAANLLTPLVASSTALTAPAAVLANKDVTISATVTSTASTAIPTGLVTFFANATPIASGTLNSSGTATGTVPASTVAPGNYTVIAVYAGDTAFKVSLSPGQPGSVLSSSIATTTTLTSSNANPGTGASVTFTATVTPAVMTDGTPSGTVTFLNGTATLGTGTLTNGVATYTTTSLPAGTQAITASYAASGIFAGSISSAVTETVVMPTFTPSATPASLTISAGSSGTTALSASTTGGYTGTLTLACGTLPAHLSCSFSTPTLALTGSNTPSSTLTIATNASSAALDMPGRPGTRREPPVLFAILLGPGLLSLGLLLRRRRSVQDLRLGMLLLAVVTAVAATGLSGCGSSSNNAARGTYSVPVTFTPSSGSAQTITLSVSVQ